MDKLLMKTSPENRARDPREESQAKSYSPPRQHRGHDPYEWWIKRKVVLEQEKGSKAIEKHLL